MVKKKDKIYFSDYKALNNFLENRRRNSSPLKQLNNNYSKYILS